VAYSLRTIGIIIASTLSVILIVIAVLVSGPLPFHLQRVDAQSTHDLLVSYAAKDTDGDGLPDWEEALYGTDPNNPHSVSQAVTDGEAVAQGLVKPKFATATSTPVDAAAIPGTDSGPQTLTDQFARGLFSQYLAQHDPSTPPTPADITTFVEGAVADFQGSQQIPDAYNQGQVHVVGSGSDALLSYAAAIESVFARNTVDADKSELDYYADAVEKNDLTALAQVKKIGAAYTAIAKGYVAVPVPREAAIPHLAVANALARLGSDITDMSTMQSDPLRSYLGLAKYQKDSPALLSALASLQNVYASEEVTVPTGTKGSSFYDSLVQATQVKSATP
jgi:hypothetical protein